MVDRPTTAHQARELMLDWAEGKRSWANFGPDEPYTPDVIAAMDTQEVEKWAAVYQSMALAEGIEGGDDE